MINNDTNGIEIITHVNDDSTLLTSVCDHSKDDTMKYELDMVQSKKTEAQRELKAIDLRRVELEQWLKDLAVTERTLAQLLKVELPGASYEQPITEKRKKPADIPSVYEMAATIIRERGTEFVDGKDIVAGINMRWWPDAKTNDISPSLWRLATKDGRLRKEGTKYALPIAQKANGQRPITNSAPS